jgi:hypothetical protein
VCARTGNETKQINIKQCQICLNATPAPRVKFLERLTSLRNLKPLKPMFQGAYLDELWLISVIRVSALRASVANTHRAHYNYYILYEGTSGEPK